MEKSERKHVFISHIHEDDALLPKLKQLAADAGLEVRDGSINSLKPNEAKSESYIKSGILAGQIQWASVMVVLISPETHASEWVNWEIEYAAKLGKRIVGVFAQGASESDLPEAFQKYGDALVGWQSARFVAAVNGDFNERESSVAGSEVPATWAMSHHGC